MTLMRLIVLGNLCLLLLQSPLASAAGDGDDDHTSAYEALKGFNFPEGLLPEGATGYELDKSTGRFRAFLNGSCSFSLQGSYQLSYKSTISGYISRNKLTKLSGISVKILFLWLNIVEVDRREDELQFSVGVASASFSIDNFFLCPRCGCGFDCSDERISKLRSNPAAYSIWSD